MATRQQRIQRIRQLCDRATYQELESMNEQRLHSLNCNILVYGLKKEYGHVFHEAEKIKNRKIAGPPSPPGLFSLIFSCFSFAEHNQNIKKPTGKIMKDHEESLQQNQQEESFLMRKGSKHEKKTQ